MSKKRKRKSQRRFNPPPALRVEEAVPIPEVKRPSLQSRQAFQPDYSYVIKDLKRIAILAGGFITLLIVLSYVLP